jgi:iron complex transport system substrate-binding protein
VHVAPTVPFNWGSRPPSVNRMLGLVWLAYVLRNREFDADFYADVRSLFAIYYHVEVADADIRNLVSSDE